MILLVVFILGYLFWDNLFPRELSTPQNVTNSPKAMLVDDYIKLNISTLSPIKETVGGKFYVTKIEATNGVGVVNYEDGHNAYTADFTYSTKENGAISIMSWSVR